MPDRLITNPEKKPAIVMTRFPYESSWGGEESHTLAIARHLRGKGFEVIFFGSCRVLLQKFAEEGFQVRSVWGGKMIVTIVQALVSIFLAPLIKWNLLRNFSKLVEEYEIRSVYCLSLNEKLFLTPAALLKKIPVTWVEHQEIRGWLLKSPWRSLYLNNAAQVKIVPISRQNKTRLLELGIARENLVEIVNGVDLEQISVFPRQTRKGFVLFANRLIPKKGVMDFLEALKALFKKNLVTEAIILGRGEQESEVKSTILQYFKDREVSVYNFLKKEKWYELLSKADVFVSCARDSNETFSLNTAEAMAAGCKVVVTRCCGIADYLTDRQDAFLADPMNPNLLVDAITQALKEGEGMRDAGRATARLKFDQKKMLEQYEALLLRKS